MKITHVVLKNDDIEKLPMRLQANLSEVQETVMRNRKEEGKRGIPKYLVINTDEPYSEEVIGILKKNGHWGETESGWLVEFKDGKKEIMTEQVYAEYTMDYHPIQTEGRNHKHFFDIQDAIKENPNTPVSW